MATGGQFPRTNGQKSARSSTIIGKSNIVLKPLPDASLPPPMPTGGRMTLWPGYYLGLSLLLHLLAIFCGPVMPPAASTASKVTLQLRLKQPADHSLQTGSIAPRLAETTKSPDHDEAANAGAWSGSTRSPRIISEPDFSTIAPGILGLAAPIQVSIGIAASGAVENIEIDTSSPLSAALEDEIRQILFRQHYQAAQHNGVPIAGRIRIILGVGD